MISSFTAQEPLILRQVTELISPPATQATRRQRDVWKEEHVRPRAPHSRPQASDCVTHYVAAHSVVSELHHNNSFKITTYNKTTKKCVYTLHIVETAIVRWK